MNTSKLSRKALKLLEKNSSLRMKIAIATGKSDGAIRYWIKTNNDLLTLTKVVSIIQAETGLTDAELFAKSNEKMPA